MWVAPGVIGNEPTLGYDVLRGIELAKVISESERLHGHRGDITLARQYGKAAIRLVSGKYSTRDFVIFDHESGLYLKSYSDECEADLQFAGMNVLHETLASASAGVAAVRHFALVSREGDAPVAVIEPARGRRVYELDFTNKERRAMMRDVRRRLDEALGKRASRALVNDLAQVNNLAANVFLDAEGQYQLIDQPVLLPGAARRAHAILKELGWQMPLKTPGISELAWFHPFDVMRTDR